MTKISYLKNQLKAERAKNNTFKLVVRSRHSNKELQHVLDKKGIRFPKRCTIRFGSSHEYKDNKDRIEINSVNAINNSSDKFKMKACFNRDGVKTANAFVYDNFYKSFRRISQNPKLPIDTSSSLGFKDLEYPIIGKLKKGSRGNGLILIESQEDMELFINNFSFFKEKLKLSSGIGISGYLFEKYHNYAREYRIHIDDTGHVIYTNRKVLKNDTPENKRYFRNDETCNWLLETNPSFDKPVNWDQIVAESKKALDSVGLNIGAVDIRIQSATNKKGQKRKNPKFFIVEINSAPSFGEGTLNEYANHIPSYVKSKMK